MRALPFVALMLLALGLLAELDRGEPPLLIAGAAAPMPKIVIIPAPVAPAVALYSTAAPPERYRRNASFRITIMDEAAIGGACGDSGFIACEISGQRRVIISNPCLFDGEYAHRLCHELGHVNGWPRMHGP
jgi:hypothetical protein